MPYLPILKVKFNNKYIIDGAYIIRSKKTFKIKKKIFLNIVIFKFYVT